MPTVDVVNLDNRVVGQVALADDVFSVPINEALLYEAVRHYQACRRAGTHKTKERGSVSGAGKKLWRQKGTGRARVGSIRSPLWRHGGTVHGPQPRDYSYHLPRKMLLGALRSALSGKLKDGELTVVEAFDLASHKTKEFRQTLDRLGAQKSVLLVESAENPNLERSSRNLPRVTLMKSLDVHPYHLLDHERVILSQATATKLSSALSAIEPVASAEAEPEPEPAPKPRARAFAPAAKVPAKTSAPAAKVRAKTSAPASKPGARTSRRRSDD